MIGYDELARKQIETFYKNIRASGALTVAQSLNKSLESQRAIMQSINRIEKSGEKVDINDMCASFQQTALSALWDRVDYALKNYDVKQFVLAGGVAANSRLREMMKEEMSKVEGTELLIPPMWCCTDNAAMIGASGQIAYNHKCFGDLDAAADPNMLMPGEK